jgi:hypothetical protein
MEADPSIKGILAQTVTSIIPAQPRKLQKYRCNVSRFDSRLRRNQVKGAKAMTILAFFDPPEWWVDHSLIPMKFNS